MADIAEIGFAADTSELKDAKSSIQALIPPAKDAEKASKALADTFAKLDTTADKLSAAASGLAASAEKLSRAFEGQSNSAVKAAAGIDKQASAATRAATGVRSLGAAVEIAAGNSLSAQAGVRGLGAAIEAINLDSIRAASSVRGLGQAMEYAAGAGMRQQQAAQGVRGLGAAIEAAGSSMKLTAREGLNFSRQFADIGVTAAMGMNPLMIAIQQGPQLFDILQEKAISTGTSVKAVMASVGATVWAALAPILPFILAIAAGVGLVVGAFALFSRAINKGNQDIIGSMGLTEKQLERVKKSGIETGATMGDTFIVSAQVIGKAIMNGPIGTALNWLGERFTQLLDFITELSFSAVSNIVAFFTAAIKTIANNWRQFPALMGAIMVAVINVVVMGVQKTINVAIDGINLLIQQANKIKGLELPELGRVVLEGAKPIEGSLTAMISGEFDAAFDASLTSTKKGMNNIRDEIAKGVGNRVRSRITAAAGDAEKGSTGRSGGKSESEKFEDIVAGAERDIATMNARVAGVNLTADAAARLANEQKLLNEASQKGITLSDEQRAKLIGLAGTLTDLEMKLKNLEGFKEINEGLDSQFTTMLQQTAQIGLVGEALATLQYQQEFVNAATSKGIILDAEQTRILGAKAAALGKLSAENARLAFMSEATTSNAETLTRMKEELSYIGMTADATARLRIENELLAQARQQNIELTPADIAALRGIAAEQATVEREINRTRDALGFAKDATRGFIGDLRSGLTEGKSLWESFGTAIINVLNKVIDKLIDASIEGMFSGGQSSGGGWVNTALNFAKMLFAKGGSFDGGNLTKFAKGGSFTNSVVSKPTLFSFANGTALGEMGEAGAEAIMPLKRGPNGSLGVQMYGGAGGQQNVAVDVRVTAGPTDDMWLRIDAVAQDKALTVTQAGLEQFDAQMPARVHQIASDDRVR